jgi:hypothetical protein
MDETRKILWQTLAAVAVALAALAGYYAYTHREVPEPVAAGPAPAESGAAATPPAAAGTSAPAAHPVDDVDADHVTPLDRSDAVFLEAVGHLQGLPAGALQLLLPKDVIRHIVATVDALPREKLALQVVPTRPVPGALRTAASPRGGVSLSPENERRYALYVRALTAPDTGKIAATYRHFYPLFQQAYRELGYPKGHFNDRLVEVIDQLLDAPEPKPPVELIAPGVMYRYADPELEALSAGEKILVRVGAANESAIKAKLRDFRNAIAAPAP